MIGEITVLHFVGHILAYIGFFLLGRFMALGRHRKISKDAELILKEVQYRKGRLEHSFRVLEQATTEMPARSLVNVVKDNVGTYIDLIDSMAKAMIPSRYWSRFEPSLPNKEEA